MLSREDNEALTRTGPGTVMGQFMRRHWLPFMTSAELAPGAPPKRVTLLGERLVAFRGADGEVALLDEFCPHRLTSLYFGRNEGDGLRCVYHGWKFGRDGACLDTPSEPGDSALRRKVRAIAYPCQERAGLIWTRMDPEADPAPLPALDWMQYPDSHRWHSRWLQDCNYMQAMEGEVDESHVSFLHSRLTAPVDNDLALDGAFLRRDRAPVYVTHETDYGLACGARRQIAPGAYLWRINLFLLPCFTLVCPSDDPCLYIGRAWVPADDEHCWVICVSWRTDRPASEREIEAWRNGEVQHRRVIPGTTIPLERADNDYLIDRDAQSTTSFSGVHGVRAQDAMAVESAGPIVDRTREHLGASDRAIIAMRRRLLAAARGAPPATTGRGGIYAAKPCQSLRESAADFLEIPEIAETVGMRNRR